MCSAQDARDAKNGGSARLRELRVTIVVATADLLGAGTLESDDEPALGALHRLAATSTAASGIQRLSCSQGHVVEVKC